MPISRPAAFAAQLAQATGGRFYTQGMPEDTKAYSPACSAPRSSCGRRRSPRRRTVASTPTCAIAFTRAELLFHYFGHVDQVSHVMWRAAIPEHPAYDAAHDAPYRACHRRSLRGPRSDRRRDARSHAAGHAARRHVGSRLRLVAAHVPSECLAGAERLSRAERSVAAGRRPMFANVDWSRTRAYGLGLNGLYLNLQGREREGLVAPAAARGARAGDCGAFARGDRPGDEAPAVTAVHQSRRPPARGPHPDRAPDLIVGYAKRHALIERVGARRSAVDVDREQQRRMERRSLHGPAGRAGRGVAQPADRHPVTSLQDLAAAIVHEVETRK